MLVLKIENVYLSLKIFYARLVERNTVIIFSVSVHDDVFFVPPFMKHVFTEARQSPPPPRVKAPEENELKNVKQSRLCLLNKYR
jgi:hypothetical protein